MGEGKSAQHGDMRDMLINHVKCSNSSSSLNSSGVGSSYINSTTHYSIKDNNDNAYYYLTYK